MSMNLVTLLYLAASVCFIQALKGLSHPTTSIRGNLFGMIGMAIAVLVTFLWLLPPENPIHPGGASTIALAGTPFLLWDLWATEVSWTERGRASVESREWRFTSLWGDVEALDKSASKMRLRRLRNVALVNTPATLNTLPLVASEGSQEPQKMESIVLTALGARDEADGVSKVKTLEAVFSEASEVVGHKSADEIRGALRALKVKADKADDLSVRLGEIEAERAAEKRDALIVTLSEAGKLPPSMHDWAKSVPLAVLESFGEAAPVVASAEPVKAAKTDSVVLTDDDKKIARLLGLSEADLLAAKTADAA